MHIHCVVVACRFLLYRILELDNNNNNNNISENGKKCISPSQTIHARFGHACLGLVDCRFGHVTIPGRRALDSFVFPLSLSLSRLSLLLSLFFLLLLLVAVPFAVHISIPIPIPVPVLISLHLKPSRVFTPFAPHCVLRPDCLSLSFSLAVCLSFPVCFSPSLLLCRMPTLTVERSARAAQSNSNHFASLRSQ